MVRVVLVRIRRLALASAVAIGAVFAAGAPGTATAAVTLPDSMASLGNSITRGFNACGFFFDCTSRSWSTGSSGQVNSHYLRILSNNLAIFGSAHNDAVSGARASDLARQAGIAVSQGVDYVTIEIGANDACRSTEGQMTPVATFRAQIDAGLAVLKQGLAADAQVFIASVPDVKRLWFIGKGSASARFAWSAFGICQSMLANPQSTAAADTARRNRVQQRVRDYNAQLALACAAYGPRCDFDDNAVFNFPFTLSQVSQWDYFHPNTAGQRIAAEITWNAGPFAG